VYSAYVPPAPKKKKKVERTRFRENARTFRQKTPQVTRTAEEAAPAKKGKKESRAEDVSMKPGKKEKIRFGQAPTVTLPKAAETTTEDAGAVDQPAAPAPAPEPVNPLLESNKPTEKTRFSARAKEEKEAKAKAKKSAKIDSMAPAAPDASEVADQQTQSSPLGLGGDTSAKKKKKAATTTGDKTRLSDKKKSETPAETTGEAPLAPAQ
jgi:peptidyl-prolyl cis-trans isomerase SurA